MKKKTNATPKTDDGQQPIKSAQAIIRIKEMMFEDPSQPIKNVLHILEAVE